MKTLTTVLILFLLTNWGFSQNSNRWFIEKKDGHLGYIDSIGEEVFTGKFDILERNYHSGLVFFQKGRKRGFLDLNGNIAFTNKELWGSFSEGLLPYKDKTGFYYLNTKGQKEIDLQMLEMPEGKDISEIYSFKNGLALVRIKNIGFDDSQGEGSCIVFAENVNLYPGNWLYGFIDKTGNWAINPNLESATSYNDSISIVEKSAETFFINTDGEFITKLDKNVGDYSQGYAIVYTDQGSYFVNKLGERLGNQIFQRVNPFSDGMASIQVENKWGFIDSTGTIVIEPKYYVRSDFKEGLTPVSQEADTISIGGSFIEAFIDKQGNEIIPFKSNVDYGNFNNGLAQGRRSIYSDEKRYTGLYELFYINKKGEKIWSEIVKQ